jgi:hypothetical protein
MAPEITAPVAVRLTALVMLMCFSSVGREFQAASSFNSFAAN